MLAALDREADAVHRRRLAVAHDEIAHLDAPGPDVGPNAKVIAPAIVSAWISSSTELSAALALIQSAAVFIALIVLLRAARRYSGELP